jgi:hypothetical protein
MNLRHTRYGNDESSQQLKKQNQEKIHKLIYTAVQDYLKEKQSQFEQPHIDECVRNTNIKLYPKLNAYFGTNYTEYNPQYATLRPRCQSRGRLPPVYDHPI